MRIAIISDIHSNADALINVLDDIKRFKVDKTISLGDNIGYGPEPNKTISLLIENKIPSVMGNHELGVLNKKLIKQFNPIAQFALNKTIETINLNSLEYVRQSNNYISKYGSHFVHGMPPDSPTSYMSKTSGKETIDLFNKIFCNICFIGHTHDLKMAVLRSDSIEYKILKNDLYSLSKDKKYLINAGSVGQPRDGNKTSKYLIFDNVSYRILVRYIHYDREKVINKMLELGYPIEHTIRLK
ncbi:MAG: metallophosphoesterase family protein [Deltaproteobacteria bacterium]|nr:metallophosphoesterase family protein [Deltaproteobacteria bacterium]